MSRPGTSASIKKRPGQENYKSRRNYLLDESKPKLAPWREKIYEIIFEADTWPGLIFDLVLLLAIAGSVIVACLETVESIRITQTVSSSVPCCGTALSSNRKRSGSIR